MQLMGFEGWRMVIPIITTVIAIPIIVHIEVWILKNLCYLFIKIYNKIKGDC